MAVVEAVPISGSKRVKKPLFRRLVPDDSQRVRRLVQFAFLALNAWIGVQFVLWARYFKTGGATHYFARPAGVDGWLPIAGLMNLKFFLLTHTVPFMHPAAMVLVVVFFGVSLLLKKTFCSWLCPVGTVSEYLWKLGRKMFKQNLTVPKWLDIPLRSLKYILGGLFVYIVVVMSVDALLDFMVAPFGIIADVKMLNFFMELSLVGAGVLLSLVLLSVCIQNFWCRYLCPYGALMGIVSALSPVRIRRDADACIDCGKCNKACPAHLKVDQLVQIRSLECTSCMECVAVCPAENALQLALPPRKIAAEPGSPAIAARWANRTVKPKMVAAVIAIVFFTLVGVAKATHHWQTYLPKDMYMRLVPAADEYGHQERLP